MYCTIVRIHRPQDRLDWSRLAPPLLRGVDLLTARFSRHRYARHSHDAYVLAVVDHGAQTFTYRGQACTAGAGDVVILAPGESHDGRPYRDGTYRYRTLHIDPGWLTDAAGHLPDFPKAVVRDGALGRELSRLCATLDRPEADTDEAFHRMDRVLEALRSRHGQDTRRGDRHSPRAERALAKAARDLMEALGYEELMTVEQIARCLGVTRSHLSRAYARTYGLPPHAWLLQRRLSHALTLIRRGSPIVEAAVTTGFVDQSHFTRRFKAVYGATPAQVAVTRVPTT